MPKKTIDFDTVRSIGLALAGVEESTAYGSPVLKVRGKILAGVPVNRAAEPDSLFISIDFDDRNELLAEAPDVYYLVEHYAPHPCVLVRLSRVNANVLRDLLGIAHKFVTAKLAPRSAPPKRRKPSPRK